MIVIVKCHMLMLVSNCWLVGLLCNSTSCAHSSQTGGRCRAQVAAVSEAMKRISDSWQAGSRRADQPPQPQPHESEAAQVWRVLYQSNELIWEPCCTWYPLNQHGELSHTNSLFYISTTYTTG
jgi:hypothetical protein